MLYDNNNFDYELAEDLYDNVSTECEENTCSHNKWEQVIALDINQARLTKNNNKKQEYQLKGTEPMTNILLVTVNG
ncbi:hypothetical protein O9G_005320 [Rozella allomycis CSF55]|uniref:Uncharacterized protein n=1 Tax=Rozella allomycis (strain CSF55) TaxID=988480 RepID=A0A075APL9_ROZAC|nr:hypothetical protein O9G_005320 [Rozella allomycis CSF55]|eukprot:EPZ32069.1 hypothetical protein O9G_005320 [Rozella allomycis CSF55]